MFRLLKRCISVLVSRDPKFILVIAGEPSVKTQCRETEGLILLEVSYSVI